MAGVLYNATIIDFQNRPCLSWSLEITNLTIFLNRVDIVAGKSTESAQGEAPALSGPGKARMFFEF